MDWSSLLQIINWKTSAFAAGYFICNIVGYFVPSIAGACSILETLAVGGGLVTAADAARVQGIVRAVDVLLVKNQLDPSTVAAVAPGGVK